MKPPPVRKSHCQASTRAVIITIAIAAPPSAYAAAIILRIAGPPLLNGRRRGRDDHVRDAIDDDVQRVGCRGLLFVDDDASAGNEDGLIGGASDRDGQPVDRESLDGHPTADAARRR